VIRISAWPSRISFVRGLEQNSTTRGGVPSPVRLPGLGKKVSAFLWIDHYEHGNIVAKYSQPARPEKRVSSAKLSGAGVGCDAREGGQDGDLSAV
jgi:hypothetical protein